MEPIESNKETHIPVFYRHRDAGRLDRIWNSTDEAPSMDVVRALVEAAPTASPIVLGGGEPTLRTDLPELITSLRAQTVLATDGLVFHEPKIVQHLVECGLSAVRLPLHTARSDAYDWLTGIPGSHRRIRLALKCCTTLGIDVSAEVTLTRPTTPYLEETVAWLVRFGVKSVRFRMLRRRGPATMEYITLAPRLGLLEPSLEAAIQLGLRHGLQIEVEGLPHCAIPRFPEVHVPTPRWMAPEGIELPSLDMAVDDHASPRGCTPCVPGCNGKPSEYVKLFGWTEFSTETDSPRREIVPTEPPRSGDVVHPPPPRAARTPATRVRNAVLQADQLNLGGDPMAGRAKGEIPEVVTVQFNHNSRSIRKELVKVSQQGATTLQIVGSMNHPSAHDLLREALRLSFPRVVLTGDICGLESLPKNKLFQLRDFDEIWVPTTANNIELANRIHTITKVPVRHYGVLQSPLQEWANRWEREEFIGTPHFAVHPQESIIDLREEFLHFPDCPEKDAIAAALSDFPNAHGGALIDAWPTLPPLTVE